MPQVMDTADRPPSAEDDYVFGPQIGFGMFSEVFLAHRRHPPDEGAEQPLYAVKRLYPCDERQGFPVTSLREIQLLQTTRHENVISLVDVFFDRDFVQRNTSVSLVFDYMPHDLSTLLKAPAPLSDANKRLFMFQLLRGVDFLHRNHIIHRDIKGPPPPSDAQPGTSSSTTAGSSRSPTLGSRGANSRRSASTPGTS